MFDLSILEPKHPLIGRHIIKVYKSESNLVYKHPVEVVSVIDVITKVDYVTALIVVKIVSIEDNRTRYYEVMDWTTGRSLTTPAMSPQLAINLLSQREAKYVQAQQVVESDMSWLQYCLYHSARFHIVNDPEVLKSHVTKHIQR